MVQFSSCLDDWLPCISLVTSCLATTVCLLLASTAAPLRGSVALTYCPGVTPTVPGHLGTMRRQASHGKRHSFGFSATIWLRAFAIWSPLRTELVRSSIGTKALLSPLAIGSGPSRWGHPLGRVCVVDLCTRSDRRLILSISPGILRDEVTRWVEFA